MCHDCEAGTATCHDCGAVTVMCHDCEAGAVYATIVGQELFSQQLGSRNNRYVPRL